MNEIDLVGGVAKKGKLGFPMASAEGQSAREGLEAFERVLREAVGRVLSTEGAQTDGPTKSGKKKSAADKSAPATSEIAGVKSTKTKRGRKTKGNLKGGDSVGLPLGKGKSAKAVIGHEKAQQNADAQPLMQAQSGIDDKDAAVEVKGVPIRDMNAFHPVVSTLVAQTGVRARGTRKLGSALEGTQQLLDRLHLRGATKNQKSTAGKENAALGREQKAEGLAGTGKSTKGTMNKEAANQVADVSLGTKSLKRTTADGSSASHKVAISNFESVSEPRAKARKAGKEGKVGKEGKAVPPQGSLRDPSMPEMSAKPAEKGRTGLPRVKGVPHRLVSKTEPKVTHPGRTEKGARSGGAQATAGQEVFGQRVKSSKQGVAGPGATKNRTAKIEGEEITSQRRLQQPPSSSAPDVTVTAEQGLRGQLGEASQTLREKNRSIKKSSKRIQRETIKGSEKGKNGSRAGSVPGKRDLREMNVAKEHAEVRESTSQVSRETKTIGAEKSLHSLRNPDKLNVPTAPNRQSPKTANTKGSTAPIIKEEAPLYKPRKASARTTDGAPASSQGHGVKKRESAPFYQTPSSQKQRAKNGRAEIKERPVASAASSAGAANSKPEQPLIEVELDHAARGQRQEGLRKAPEAIADNGGLKTQRRAAARAENVVPKESSKAVGRAPNQSDSAPKGADGDLRNVSSERVGRGDKPVAESGASDKAGVPASEASITTSGVSLREVEATEESRVKADARFDNAAGDTAMDEAASDLGEDSEFFQQSEENPSGLLQDKPGNAGGKGREKRNNQESSQFAAMPAEGAEVATEAVGASSTETPMAEALISDAARSSSTMEASASSRLELNMRPSQVSVQPTDQLSMDSSPEMPDGRTPMAEFGASIEKFVLKGTNKVKMRLDPPELGAVDVDIEVVDGDVFLSLKAETAAAAADLQAQLELLKESLEEQGLNLKEFELGHGAEDAEGSRDGNESRRSRAAKEEATTGDKTGKGADASETNGVTADGRVDMVV